MSDNFNILIRKLDHFIRKYYKNQLIRGGIYCVALFVLFYLLVTLLEYFAYFNPVSRTILFYIYLVSNTVILWKFIISTILKILKAGKTISREQAAEIIGKHFPEVSDKLLNTIQLKYSDNDIASMALIEASIEQRTKELNPIPFAKAIDFRGNKKYLKYAFPPVLILILFLLVSPKLITEPSYRIIHHNEYFEKSRPYELVVMNHPLEAVQQEDFRLEVKVLGDETPSGIYIEYTNGKFRLSRESAVKFDYTFINVQKDIDFKLVTDEYTSTGYTLKVIPKPIILNFEVIIDHPEYTGKHDETLNNAGDIVIPEGTVLAWKFYTRDATGIHLHFNKISKVISGQNSNTFTYSDKFFESQNYSVSIFNSYLKNPDSLIYSISVFPDIYPSIIVEEFKDSLLSKNLYFRGLIKDDYGFNRLTFNYIFLNNFDSARIKDRIISEQIPISSEVNQQQFFHHFNLNELNTGPGDELEYYFEVWDNDGVNGSKKTRSQKMFFRAPTLEEIEKETDKSSEHIKDDLEQSLKDIKLLQKQIDKIQKKLVNKESLSWEDKQQLQNMLDHQMNLQNKIDNIRQENIQKSLKEQQYKEINQDILEKQKQLEELFDELMTDEIKELFEELHKLLNEIDKDKVNEMLEKIKMGTEEISKELDRTLELFKQLEFDKILTETIDKLNKLSTEQDKLSHKAKDRKNDLDDLENQQQELNEKFQEIRDDLDDLEQKNKELEEPNDLINTDNSEQEIQQDMENSLNSLQNNQRRNASKSQINASEKMQQLSDFLISMQQLMNQQSLMEDIHALREILENLVQLSFDQEDLMKDLVRTNVSDPRYIQLIQDQSKINDDLQMVEDSLYALSKRQISIQSFVNREIEVINRNVEETLEYMHNHRKGNASSKQQYVMTSINNLALLLSEALRQMEQNLSMCSSSSCKSSGSPKPGKGKSGKNSLSDLQKQLNKSIEQLKNGMEGKDKGQSRMGSQSMSEQLARLAAQQEAIRRQLQEYLDQIKEGGVAGDAGINKLMEDMEKSEEDLVNKMLTNETLKRQQDIVTRLLKHDKAEKEREKEERRESIDAKNQKYSNPNEFIEYKRLRMYEAELLKTVPPQLRLFYKNKVTEYFYNFIE